MLIRDNLNGGEFGIATDFGRLTRMAVRLMYRSNRGQYNPTSGSAVRINSNLYRRIRRTTARRTVEDALALMSVNLWELRGFADYDEIIVVSNYDEMKEMTPDDHYLN